MQKFAIIVAGGSGSRMKSDIPKQFLELNGQPILMHTLNAFAYGNIQIILVLPENQVSFWKELVEQHDFDVKHEIVAGGNTRFQSVKNGLSQIHENGLVAIHDGVRPLISKEIIESSYEVAEENGNAIVSVPLKDSIRSLDEHGNQMEDRSAFRLIQTPQTFQTTLIKKAFEVEFNSSFTDDASVLEKAGHAIHLIDGDYKNIKVTTPEDLKIAEAFLQS